MSGLALAAGIRIGLIESLAKFARSLRAKVVRYGDSRIITVAKQSTGQDRLFYDQIMRYKGDCSSSGPTQHAHHTKSNLADPKPRLQDRAIRLLPWLEIGEAVKACCDRFVG